MVSKEQYQKHEVLEMVFYVALGIGMAVILPLFVGFGLRGFEESFIAGRPLEFGSVLVTYLIYYILVVSALAVVIFPIANLTLIRPGQHPATQENPTWWRIFTVSLIHNPEQGALYTMFRKIGLGGKQNYMRWSISLVRMIIIGSIVFASLGAFSLMFPPAQVVATPQAVVQQVTPFTEVIFTAEPPAFSETGTMLFLFLLLLGINAYICSKFRLGILAFFAIGFLVICPMIGFAWLGFHSIIYAGSDQARFATFIFGWLGSTLTLAFGSFLFWYLWHFWNNIFAKLSELAPGNQDIIFVSFLLIAITLILYIAVEIFAWRYRKKKAMEVPEPTF